MKTINKSSNIAIIGGGISGLALAILLKQKGYRNLKVFEKDESFQSRRQGYGLTILQGKRVLKELGVLEQVKHQNSPTKAHYFFNEHGSLLGFYGTIFWDSQKANRSHRWKEKGLSMHIPRQQLRRQLLDRLATLDSEHKTVIWNSKLEQLQCDKESIVLQLSNQLEKADLVVGCDGIFSTLRKLATIEEKELNFLGVMIVLGISGSEHTLATERIFQSSNGSGRFYSMPFRKDNPQCRSMWQFSIPMSEDRIREYQKTPEKLKEFMKEYCKNWHQPIPQLIDNTSIQDIMILPALDRDPDPPRVIDPRVILTGDACHPMSPFKSQGANQALLDSSILSSLMQKHQDIQIISHNFFQQQHERTQRKVLASRQRVQKYHTHSYLSSQSYIYPKIDLKLVTLINEAKIDFNSGNQLQQKIVEIMRTHLYFQ